MTNYWKLLTTWRTLRAAQYWPVERIRHYQLAKFKKLINQAYENVPMYRELYDSQNFKPADVQNYEDIEKVPVVTKSLVRNTPIEHRIDARLATKGNIHKETTSGSTGEPVEIWTDSTGSMTQALKAIRFMQSWGYSPTDKTIQLWRPGVQLKQSTVQRFGFFQRKLVSMFDDSGTVIDTLVNDKFEVLFATRSALQLFADKLKERGIKLNLKIVISCSEVLTHEHRQLFEEIYGCTPLEIYGCTEVGNIAWGCPANPLNLHLDMETALVNLKPIQYDHISGGQTASITVTDLENYLMPFIRFELSDIILLPEDKLCSCGRTLPLLGQVLGRNDDILEYGERSLNFQYFYHHFKDYLYMKRYKIIQNSSGDIEFHINLFEDTAENRQGCQSDLTKAFGQDIVPLKIIFVDSFPVSPTGKFKVIEKIQET